MASVISMSSGIAVSTMLFFGFAVFVISTLVFVRFWVNSIAVITVGCCVSFAGTAGF